MIQDIAIEQLDIHPQNVRKVYTDIDELAESIKARGVMQNLTVVPNPDKKDHYLVVIGNRRLTAARKAGLKTMPCSVVEMTEKEQISTMLLENMQRSDLSVSEQAQGFQLMLDLGETETTIAEKTGFSRSTVRHRLNLAKLDQETLTRREENKDFQLTLTDLYELEKVQDIKKRNEILKTAVSSREIACRVHTRRSGRKLYAICNRCSGKRKCRFSLKSRVKTENQKNINRKMLRMVQQAYRGI